MACLGRIPCHPCHPGATKKHREENKKNMLLDRALSHTFVWFTTIGKIRSTRLLVYFVRVKMRSCQAVETLGKNTTNAAVLVMTTTPNLELSSYAHSPNMEMENRNMRT